MYTVYEDNQLTITAKKWGLENGWAKKDLSEAYNFIAGHTDLSNVNARTKLDNDELEKLEEALEVADAAEDSADDDADVNDDSEVIIEEVHEPELSSEEAARLRKLRRLGVKHPTVLAADSALDKRPIKVWSIRDAMPKLTITCSGNGEAVRQYILMMGIPHSRVHEHTFRCTG